VCACSPHAMHMQDKEEEGWKVLVWHISWWSESKISRASRFRDLGFVGMDLNVFDSQSDEGMSWKVGMGWWGGGSRLSVRKDNLVPWSISGNERPPVVIGAMIFSFDDSGIDDVRKCTDELLEWVGTCRYLFRNFVYVALMDWRDEFEQLEIHRGKP